MITATHSIQVRVNGRPVSATVVPRCTLADFLRERAGLTGTHIGCREGVCGSCTVLINGDSARSCLTLAVQANGAEVTTVEGLSRADGLSEVQSALLEHHGFQCGFCTPGVVVLIEELLAEVDTGARPSAEDVRNRLTALWCRCTGYAPIVAAATACVTARVARGPR